MKIDERVKENVIIALLETLDCLVKDIREIIDDMREAQTVEKFMELKRELLFNWVHQLPLGINHCYFCQLYFYDGCEGCPYAKQHGKCNDDEEAYKVYEEGLKIIENSKMSDYAKISVARKILRRLINDYYYSNESYD